MMTGENRKTTVKMGK